AVKWFRKAAEQGDVDAQKGLAQCYYSGKGIEQNNAEAMTWHRQATEQGNTDALTILNSQPQFAPKDNIVIKDTLEHKKGPLLLLGESIERKRREMEIIKEAKAAAPKFGL
ncbi:MAG: sel1 repeat family protein, partial [Prevotellaceae bacterium]|nr:sel1 repeat family protein [Prevotellaceae bacterium]